LENNKINKVESEGMQCTPCIHGEYAADGDVISVGQVVHLALLHLWAGTEGKWDVGLV